MICVLLSHPVWVRGLKHVFHRSTAQAVLSHPVWVRGLKPKVKNHVSRNALSHPVWVRGLKQEARNQKIECEAVAPRVGAWIETDLTAVKHTP